jgi:lipoprotein-anchoring transpeptidase ErfK/SrfK
MLYKIGALLAVAIFIFSPVGINQVRASAPEVLYASGSLVNDSGTIYLIRGSTKAAFASQQAFTGLGYNPNDVINGSTAGYTLSQYQISTDQAAHPWGTWLSYNNTIYYSTSSGLMGVPNQQVFASDGGSTDNVLPANQYDIAEINNTGSPAVLTNNDPIVANETQGLPQHIYVSIAKQELRYYSGSYEVGDILISSGIPGMDTPTGEYTVLAKYPTRTFEGPGYYYPNTKWALLFKPSASGNYYIHGAYWHHNFGHVMSHGCVNVSYGDMGQLYDWANVGTPITIVSGDFPQVQ